jgi:hypothetical protein
MLYMLFPMAYVLQFNIVSAGGVLMQDGARSRTSTLVMLSLGTTVTSSSIKIGGAPPPA